MPRYEVFYVSMKQFIAAFRSHDRTWRHEYMRHILGGDYDTTVEDAASELAGYWYWYCEPGCLPDSDPIGPYGSELTAEFAARDDSVEVSLDE